MKSESLLKLKQQLLQLQAELLLLDKLASDSTRTVTLDQTCTGRLTRMDALQGQQMAQQAQRRRQQRLAGISIALAEIEKGDFGYCQECGEKISLPRLHADPTHRLCIQCAE